VVQNDLVHAWGLDYKLGYCAHGDRTLKTQGAFRVSESGRKIGRCDEDEDFRQEMEGSCSQGRVLDRPLPVATSQQ
jgi:hypothetical protein